MPSPEEEGSVAISAVAAGVPIVSKQLADAVQDTDLASYPTSTDTLLITRMMTQNCVVFTALSRDADWFRILVIGDLCTASTEIFHKIALNALGQRG